MTQPAPPVLYKYMSEKRIDFFSNPQLLFTFPERFNDDLDCEPRVKGFIRPEYAKARLQTTLEEAQAESPDVISNVHNAICTMGSDLSNMLNDKEKFDETFGPLLPYFEELMEKNDATEQNQDSNAEALQKERYDFREMLQKIFKGANSDFFGIEDVTEWLNMAPAILAELASKLELSQHEQVDELIQNINSRLKKQNIGILCLTEDYASNKMWGLYASAHAGIVLGLDTENKLFHALKNIENPFGALKKISYKPENDLAYFTDYITDEIQKSYEFLHDTIFTKDDQWEYEKEWRIAINIPKHLESIPKGILISVPPAIVKSVYLGSRVASDLQEEATAFCKKHGIPLFKMKSSCRKLEAVLIP